MERIAEFILARQRPILWVIALLTIAAIYPALNTRADFSLEGFFPENDPTIDQYQAFAEEFGRDDNVIIIALSGADIFTEDAIRAIGELSDSVLEIENVTQTRSILDTQMLTNRDGMLTAEPLFENNRPALDLEDIRSELLRNPFTERSVINREGNFTAVLLYIDEDKNNFPVRSQVISDMYEVLNSWDSRFEVYVAGIPYFRNQYVHLLNSEIIFYISISSILIILLLYFLFRNVQGVLIPILIVWLTILFTVAVLYLTGGYFEVLTSTIAPILLCVGIADSVHMLAKYNDGRMLGLNPKESRREALIVLGSATFLTSVTTAIGFGTLMTSNVIPMRTFGVYTAIGVLLAFIITIFLLPSLMPYFKDSDPVATRQGRVQEAVGSSLRWLFRVSIRHHKAVVIGTLLLTLVTGYGMFNLKVNGFVFDDVGRDSDLVKNSNLISEKLSPQFTIEFLIDSGSDDGITDPDLIAAVAEFENFLLDYDEFAKTMSFATLVSEIHRVMDPENHERDPLPDSRQLIAQYVLLMELTDTDALENVADFSYRTIRLSTQTYDVGSWRINQIREEIQLYIDEHFQDQDVLMTGTPVLVADLTDNIVFSLASSILLAFLFISLIMAWLFRNMKLVLISLIPNLMPLVIVAGVMGYFGVDIKPSTAVIFTIAFGIAVDDSIHFLARFRIETLRGFGLLDAIRITTEKTGRAIVLTSAILLVGFGTLGNSEFESTMLMGQLVTLTIFVALLADLFMLPALIYWLRPDLPIRKEAPTPDAKPPRESVPEPALH